MIDLNKHDDILTAAGWELQHEFYDEGKYYEHPDKPGKHILVYPEGTWDIFVGFSDKPGKSGYNDKDLEKTLKNESLTATAKQLMRMIEDL